MLKRKSLLFLWSLIAILLIHPSCNDEINSGKEDSEKVTLGQCLSGKYPYRDELVDECVNSAKKIDNSERKGKIYHHATQNKYRKLQKIMTGNTLSKDEDVPVTNHYAEEIISLANKALACKLNATDEKNTWRIKYQAIGVIRFRNLNKEPGLEKEISNCNLHILNLIISDQKEKEVINPIHLEHDCRKTHVDRAELSRCLSEIKPFNYYREQNDIIRSRYSAIQATILHCLSNEENKQTCIVLANKIIEEPETRDELLNYLRNEEIPPTFPPGSGP